MYTLNTIHDFVLQKFLGTENEKFASKSLIRSDYMTRKFDGNKKIKLSQSFYDTYLPTTVPWKQGDSNVPVNFTHYYFFFFFIKYRVDHHSGMFGGLH